MKCKLKEHRKTWCIFANYGIEKDTNFSNNLSKEVTLNIEDIKAKAEMQMQTNQTILFVSGV